jgi:DNA-binding CsgD family transcriptional regulator
MDVPCVWEPEHLAAIDTAVTAARSGRPTVLAIEGAPGAGKSSLFREALSRAAGFVHLVAEAPEGTSAPYSTLAALGVRGVGGAPFVAAQALREAIDARARTRAVAVAVDDLQWADPESVEALVWLTSRASGDRLLVIGATRPLPPGAHPDWQSQLGAPAVHRMRLAGLSAEAAVTLAQTLSPELGSSRARRVWEATEGNALYFVSLLREHSPEELESMRWPPAPATFAADLEARLGRLGEDERAFMRAASVIGGTWQPIWRTADVAQVEEPSRLADRLAAAGLLELSMSGLSPSARPAHALIRAAVRQSIPLPDQRRLHERAAAGESDPLALLEHRIAASEGYNDDLARDLEDFAVSRHQTGQFRSAAEHLRAAAELTRDGSERARRLLEARLDAALAGDVLGPVDVGHVASAESDDRRRLVRGVVHALRNEWGDAVRQLSSITAQPSQAIDPLVRFRAEALSAWLGVGGDAPTDRIAAHVGAAKRLGVSDPAFQGFLDVADGTVSGRLAGTAGYDRFTALVPPAAADTAPEHTYRLAFRGMTRFGRGFHAGAIADLGEVERRMRAGVFDIGDGQIHAYLGGALWMSGQWQLAEAKLRLAEELRRGRGNPMTVALTSLGHIARGEEQRAEAMLAEVRAQLAGAPWREGLEFYLVALWALLHSSADADRRRRAWADLHATFPAPVLEPHEPLVALWLVPRAHLAIWGGDERSAERALSALAEIEHAPAWRDGATHWLRGLLAEARGEAGRARREFDDALVRRIDDFPLLHAHALADRAAVSSDPVSAAAASDAYRRLGLTRYAEAVAGPAPKPAAPPNAQVLATLSDRERDVAMLAGAGLSYAQIARELFVSRSTVSFHLSRIYAKTGVATRHALGDLIRTGIAPG